MKIVQVGACRGDDHVKKLVKDAKIDFLLLVEANPLNIDALKQCYKDYPCVIENVVITADLTTNSIPFYYSVSDGPGYEVSTIKKAHIRQYYREEELRIIDLPALSLEALLDKYEVKDLDYLFLDIEGIDADVALSLDLNKYNIRNLQIEFLHLGDKMQSVIDHINGFGYELGAGIDLHNYDKMFTKCK